MPRRRHPKKEIEAALKFAEGRGWRVEMKKRQGGHAWGRIISPGEAKEAMTQVHEFELALRVDATTDEFLDEIADLLQMNGCDDATFTVQHGVPHIAFQRDSRDLADAISSAIRDAESVPGVAVERIEVDTLVTASEIARRVGRTRQNVHQLITGARGPGSFPEAVPGVGGQTKLYEWTDVVRWFADALGEPVTSDPDAALSAAFNAALQTRRRTRELDEPAQRDAVASLLR